MAFLPLDSYYYCIICGTKEITELPYLPRSGSYLKYVNVMLQSEGTYSESMSTDFSSECIVRGLFVHAAMRLNN